MRLHLAAAVFLGLAVFSVPVAAQTATPEPKPTPEVQRLLEEGAERNKTWLQRLPTFEQALKVAQERRDRVGEGQALFWLGRVWSGLGQPENALKFYNRALPILQEVGDRGEEATILNNIGRVYSNLGQHAQAMTYYKRALPIRRELKDREGEATTLNNMGLDFSGLGQPSKALEYYGPALRIFRQLEYRAGEATTLNNIGLVYSGLGQPVRELEYYAQALPIFRELEDRRGEAMTLNNIGSVYAGLGQTARALECCQRALQFFREVMDPRGEALALGNIASVHSRLNRPAQALKDYERALSIRRELKDRGGEATTLNNVGSTYSDLGQPIKALDHLRLALPIFRELEDLRGEAMTLSNIGSVYAVLGQPTKALQDYERALRLFRGVMDRRSEATTLSNIGSIYADLGRATTALAYFEQALPIKTEVEDPAGEATTLNNIGTIYSRVGLPARALAYYERALPIKRQLREQDDEAATLGNIATTMVGSQPFAAIYFSKQSANVLQTVRLGASGMDGDLRGRMSRKNEGVFRFLAPLLLEQSRQAEALQAMDLLKAQERTEADRAAWSGNMPLTPKEAKWDAQIQAVGKPLAEAGARQQALRLREGLVAAKALEPELERLRTAYSGAIRRVIEESKKGSGKLESTPAFERIKRATPRGTAAVYALYRENVLHLLVATNGSLRPFKTSVKDLGKRVTTFRQVLEDPTRDPRPSGLAIYKVLAAPIEVHLKAQGVKTVLWSLDGALRLIPVGALWDGEKFLVERRVHAYFPGSDALRPDDNRTGYRVLACGASKAAPGYAALPGVDAELTAISAAFPGKPLRNGEFTRKALEAGLRAKPTVLHLASHFSLRPGPPENSQLLLGDGTRMSLQELESLPNSLFASLRLVVLSACETAPGAEDSDGYAAEGMAERLLRKGVGAVAASLWPVADQPTAELMRRMYAKLAANPKTSPLAALRSVQLEFLSGREKVQVPAGARRSDTKAKRAASAAPKWPAGLPRYAHPYWAPFVFTGNPR